MAGNPEQGVTNWLPAARAGSREALGSLLEACRRYLLWVARRELDPGLQAKGGASDLVQETFLEAQRDFAQFQGDSETELLAWLRRLLLNNLADFTRFYRATAKRGVGREISLDAGEHGRLPEGGMVAATPSPGSAIEQQEQLELFHRVIAELPSDYCRVITLWHDEERSFKEIGQLMGRTENAARSLWWRAMQRLQQELAALV